MQLVAATVYYLPAASEFSTCCSALLYISGAVRNEVLSHIWLNVNNVRPWSCGVGSRPLNWGVNWCVSKVVSAASFGTHQPVSKFSVGLCSISSIECAHYSTIIWSIRNLINLVVALSGLEFSIGIFDLIAFQLCLFETFAQLCFRHFSC